MLVELGFDSSFFKNYLRIMLASFTSLLDYLS